MINLKGEKEKKKKLNFHLQKKKKAISYCMSIKAIIPDGFYEGMYNWDRSQMSVFTQVWSVVNVEF